MRAQTVPSMAVVVGAMAAWLVESPAVKAAPKSLQVTVANMHIDPGAGQYNLLPDATGPTYVDYRVPGGDACVQGEVYPAQLASVTLPSLWLLPDAAKAPLRGVLRKSAVSLLASWGSPRRQIRCHRSATAMFVHRAVDAAEAVAPLALLNAHRAPYHR